MTLPPIAFLGTGLMGRPMAASLLAGGYRLIAWNRTLSKAEALGPLGATVAPTAARAAERAEVAITMLESGAVVEAVLFGDGDAAASLAPGGLVIDMSSIEPNQARAHAEKLAARGIGYLDAPVSGGTLGAEQATLAIMVGGTERDFARGRPILATMGRPTHVGPAGLGQLAKLCNQAIVAITVGAVAEALLLAAATGADPARVRQALTGGSADSPILRNQGQRMLDRDFVPGGSARIVAKDLGNILNAARERGLELPVCERVAELFKSMIEHGGAGYDHTALLLELERLNAGRRVGNAPDRLPR